MKYSDVLSTIKGSAQYKFIAELSRGRILIECEVQHLTQDARLMAVRAEQPKAENRVKFDKNVKSDGLINAIQALPADFDGVFKLLVWDGNQRITAYGKNTTAPVEVVVWALETVESAIERGSAANHLLFQGVDDDIFSLLDYMKDDERIADVTGKSQKTIARYKLLHQSGLKTAIKTDKAFPASYGLKLLDIAGSDPEKQKAVIDVAKQRVAWAKRQIQAELERAAERGENASPEKTNIKEYFAPEGISFWRDELKAGKTTLTVDYSKKSDPVDTGDDDAWSEGVPKADIEGRKWKQFSVAQFDQLREFANRLLDEVDAQEAARKAAEEMKKKRARDLGRRSAPLGKHEDAGSDTVGKQQAPKVKSTPIHAEGVGAGENPGPSILDESEEADSNDLD